MALTLTPTCDQDSGPGFTPFSLTDGQWVASWATALASLKNQPFAPSEKEGLANSSLFFIVCPCALVPGCCSTKSHTAAIASNNRFLLMSGSYCPVLDTPICHIDVFAAQFNLFYGADLAEATKHCRYR
jgi:hypothetical protein